MWDAPGQDPGGGSDPPPSSGHELSDLKDQFEQQKVLIAQLKEMIRKSGEPSSVTQEKVDEYMNTLSRHSAKSKKLNKSTTDEDQTRKTADIPASQRISLLRQQVEENKLRLAERGKSQKGIEEMVTQLQAQLDDSQHLISQNSLNISLQDTSTKLEYSENSTSQELYTILLSKEKRITDLLGKVQKLETSIIDLQENVKEKDSVIDARTKAITLMTENLSRKGKTTLDALDDTKEQMRKMQENFVALEAEMKARQMKLLDDLKSKNYEIAELQETNLKLSNENEALNQENVKLRQQLENNDEIKVLQERIKELELVENKSEPASSSNNSPQRTGSGRRKGKNKGKQQQTQSVQSDSSKNEIETLSTTIKSLNEEIDQWKAKEADYETKIKDLTQELFVLKSKEVDVGENDELAKLKKQLDESNKSMIKVKAQNKSKIKELQKKIDEFKKVSDANSEILRLESENCKLSQKLAELEEEKGSLQLKIVECDSSKVSEREKELQEQIEDHQRDLEEKDKIISILEADITKAKTEIETLSEQLNSLSHLENAQVSTEMASIQFEEQMDSLQNEKKHLQQVNETFEKERDELLERINDLKKEKHDLSTKLEHYIQENIELIDKLEKLSAEKVSSAESIEIVEGLTQQEKLELEAYQKNLDMMAGNLKTSEENLPQADLNESVNELREETSELLQKIELFTVERREVMDKMEDLRQENNALNLKLKEIENNRDVLVETYEQLQTEKELVDEKLEAALKLNNELQQRQKSDVVQMDSIQKYIDEINELKAEIDGYKVRIDEKEADLDSLAHMVKELQDKCEDEEREKSHLSNNLIDINRTLAEMEVDYTKLQQRVQELEEHNNSLSELLEKSQEELETATNAEWEHQRLIEAKNNEIEKLQNLIESHQQTIREKDEHIQNVQADLKQKYESLQKKLRQNSENMQGMKPLEAKIEELNVKNKEQLDKMKKIAANLKKKTQAYQELEGKMKSEQEKWEKEASEKDKKALDQAEHLQNEITSLKQLFDAKSCEYNQLVHDFDQYRDEKCAELRKFEEKNAELQSTLQDLRVRADKANEMNLQQELIQTHEPIEELNAAQMANASQTKIQQLEMIIETQESEIVQYKERIAKLEEGLSFVEERRLSLERKANELGAELEEKSVTCDEMSQAEDMLEKRLQALAAHDEAIEKKLAETLDDNKDLQQRNQKLSEKCEKFKRKLAQTLEKLKEVDGQQTIVGEIENENAEMKKQLTVLENELKHSQAEYGRILEESKSDLERLNNDWQQQFDVVLQEKNELTIKCEKLMEQIAEQSEKIEEANEIKLKLDANQAETRNYEEQIQKFHAENQELKQQLNEKVDKPVVQQQNASLSSYFDNVVPSEEIIAIDYKEQYERINAEKSLLEEEIRNLRLELNDKNHMTNSNNLSLQSANNLSSFFEQPLFDRSSTEIDELKEKIAQLQQELENQRQKHEKNPEIVNPPAVVPNTMWQNEETDPFAFVANSNEAIIVPQQQQQQTQSAPTISGNTEEELLNKIKTLEFMLYSVEKEKDDALLQCHELTNELTRLVYKNENLSQNQIVNLESQILNENETQVDGNELKTIEFEKTRPTALSSLEGGTVSEEYIQPKTAYVCTENDEQQHSASLPSNLNAIESQIVSNFEPSPQETQQLHQLEFEPTLPPISSTDGRPVHEPSMTTQDAYLCFGENDDGWGCSPEEAKLEEDYVQNLEGAAAQLPLDEMRAKIHRLESERDSHLEENKQMQVKISKLVKKLKELKVKNEQLTSEKKANDGAGADFFNLDDTIQEELKLQIQQIEKKLKETKNELDKEKSEKASILKRIDVLTSANERMVEMKEKQDVELLGWQQNCRELQGKLQQFEWGDDGFNSNNAPTAQNDVVEQDQSPTKENPSELLQKIDELNETIRELSLDNEELQTLLEEQRNLRLNAEKAKATEVIADNMKTESEFLQVVREKETLQDEINDSLEEKKRLQDQVNNLIKTNAELLEKFAKIETESQQLQMAISEKDETISQINNTNFVLTQEKAQVMDLLKNMETEKEQLLQNQSTLNSNAERIQQLMQEKEILFQELQTRNIQVSTMQENVNSDMSQLKIDLEHEIEKAEKLLKENQQLCAAVEEKDSEISRLNVEIANKTQEMTSVIEQLNQEWELRVDQRGTDVAESWKLHLETRETEFGELEARLRKEIDELEAKSNALVNENNELRKNVDAEIRNEVDRVAALQQQINDRQTMINELSQQLQEKQTQLDGIQGECALIKTTMDENCRLIAELRALFAVDDDQVKLIDEIKMQIERRDDNERQVEELRQQLDVLNANFAHMQEESNKKLANLSDVEAKAEEYRVQLETLKDNHVLLQQNLADQSHTIANLTGTLQQVQNLKDYENENTQNLQHNISELQRTNNEVNQQLMEKINEVEKYERMINEKDGEILRYSQLLEEKEREYTYALENLNQENKIALNEEIQKVDVMKKRLLDNENHYEELLAAKQSEIETLNLQLNELKEQQNEILRYENIIREKDGEISVLRAKIEENEVDLNEMRGLIEEKTMEIEKLQNSYYEKSNDLDALIAEMDMSKLQQVQSETTVASATTTASKVEDELDDDDLSQPVRRAELDLALYIIHQRDMRCEELTIELTQLLEERDTLQLRLSNALREKEEIVRKYKIDELPASSSLEGNQISESSGAVPKHQQQQEKIDVQSNLDPLATKLSELKATGYRKDKTIVDEQELRRFQQLSIMQQHRDDAAKLPAEAAARLVDASYTLSRDVQSPSKVLLNWLWGRSTPKVNNI